MKSMSLAYGRREIPVTLPAEIEWQTLKKEALPSPPESKVIAQGIVALQTQLESLGLKHSGKVAIVVPDHTRRCRLEKLLPRLTEMLEADFAASIEILVACGTHALQDEVGISALLGEAVHRCFAVHQHDCRKPEELEFWGITSRGTPVHLSRRLKDADVIVAVGGVRYHYFAGFGGGPKMIFPGLAGYEAIRANHFLSLDLEGGRMHPGCREGELDTNPVHLDICEAVARVPRVLSWSLLLDHQGRIRAGEVGDLFSAQRRLCLRIPEHSAVALKNSADIVLASAGGYPADVDLIQAHKAIHHAHAAVRSGGWLVMLAECAEGIGSTTFLEYFTNEGLPGIVRLLKEDYRLNGQTALALRKKAEEIRIVLVSSLDPQTIRRIGMIPAGSLEEAWKVIRRENRGNLRHGYVFPQASEFLLVPEP